LGKIVKSRWGQNYNIFDKNGVLVYRLVSDGKIHKPQGEDHFMEGRAFKIYEANDAKTSVGELHFNQDDNYGIRFPKTMEIEGKLLLTAALLLLVRNTSVFYALSQKHPMPFN
jgi:hypothetical protein